MQAAEGKRPWGQRTSLPLRGNSAAPYKVNNPDRIHPHRTLGACQRRFHRNGRLRVQSADHTRGSTQNPLHKPYHMTQLTAVDALQLDWRLAITGDELGEGGAAK
jgi:hypothetical protein